MTDPLRLRLPGRLLAEIHAHLEHGYPGEAAGLLLGADEGDVRTVERVLPVENQFAADQRGRRYMIEPLDMLRAEETADELGLQIVGVYHSHPDHPPRPSQFDLEMAVPWYWYLITSVPDGRAGESRIWLLDQDQEAMLELTLELEEENR